MLYIFAALAGSAVASTYLLQPLLPQLAATFAEPGIASVVAALSPLGYMVGLLTLGSFSDGEHIRKIILYQGVGLVCAVILSAMAIWPAMLAVSVFLTGMLATIAAQCLALAARLLPGQRGRAVGMVGMGMSLGALLGRIMGGFLGDLFGWRVALLVFGLLMSVPVLLFRLLPIAATPPGAVRPKITDLGRALPSMLRDTPKLRSSVVLGWCYYTPFSALWSAIALQLAGVPQHYGPAVAGSFGFLGIAGAAVVRVAGPATDKYGSRPIILISLVLGLLGFLLMMVGPASVICLATGTLLVDVACFGAHTANQTSVVAIAGERQGRMFSAFTLLHAIGGIVGGAVGPLLYNYCGWQALAASSAVLLAGGILLGLGTRGSYPQTVTNLHNLPDNQ